MSRRKRYDECPFHRGNLSIPDDVSCRIFEIGLGRSATRSVWQAVCRLGFNGVHGGGGCIPCIEDAVQCMVEGRLDLVLYRQYEYCGHLPSYHWKALATRYPEARFILPVREVNEWAGSMRSTLRRSVRNENTPPRGALIRQAIFGSPHPSKGELIIGALNYWAEVRDFFQGTNACRLLEMNVFEQDSKTLWRNLCDFLEVNPPPEKEFPRKVKPVRMYNGPSKPPQVI